MPDFKRWTEGDIDATGSARLFPEIDPDRSRYCRIAPGSCRWGLRPLPIVEQNGASSVKAISECPGAHELFGANEGNGATRIVPEKALVDLTPREQHVLEALQLGLPNKLIAVRLNLSENTVKMHIQRIMRKCSAHNRTEAVIRWSRRANGHAQP
jgi:DNA-binding CsgD family transcriptional regulator